MLENRLSQDAPEVTLLIEVAAPLDRLLDQALPLGAAALQRLTQGLVEILETLGIPGSPKIRIASLAESSVPAHGDQLLRLFVNGQRRRYSTELLRLIRSYLSGLPQDVSPEPAQTLTWLNSLAGAESEPETVAEFLNLFCLEAIKGRPSILLGPEQLKRCHSLLSTEPKDVDLPSGNWPPEPDWLHPILSRVLDQKISLADRRTVAAVLSKGIAERRAPEDLAEDLINKLIPDVVEIHLAQEYLRELTLGDQEKQYDRFSLMRDGLFNELGVHYPRFHFTPDADLKPRSFAFRINHLMTLPRFGLRPNQCLVNEFAQALEQRQIAATPAINPATGDEFSLIDFGDRGEVEATGMICWNPLEYLVLSFSVDLRANSVCFIHRGETDRLLGQVELGFPVLGKEAQSKFTVEQITRVLRALSAEQISLQNLRLILEALLDFDYLVVSPQHLLFDDRLPTGTAPDTAWLNDPINLTSFVRVNMKRFLSHKYAKGRLPINLASFVKTGSKRYLRHNYVSGQQNMDVYLLDPEIERIVSSLALRGQKSGIMAENQHDLIIESIRRVISKQTGTALPAILTILEVSPALREIIAPEFPRLPVVAYQELSPETNIQPIARIDLIL